jgi:hypothetical protein
MRPPYRLVKTTALAGVLAGALAAVPSAQAASAPPMIVVPHPASGGISSYFDLTARPGRATPAGTLELRNRLDRRVTVLLDRVDGLTASTLGSAYRVRGNSIHGPTRWTRLSARRVVLGPRGKAEVRITLIPSRGSRPGDYLSGISVQARESNPRPKARGNLAISSVQRYAIGVVMRVPGPRHPLIRLTRARIAREAAGVTFYLDGRNRGNVILQNVEGRLTITQGKRLVARKTMGPGTFVSGTSIAYPLLAPKERPHEGTVYRVRAFLRYRGGVARLDTLVRFGHRSALRQRDLGGPGGPGAAHKMSLSTALILALAAAVTASGSGVSFWFYYRRRKRSPLRTLEQALASARQSGEPLSLIHVTGRSAPERNLASELSPRLRRSDRLCRLNGSGLLVVASDTSVQTAELLAGELRRQLERGDVGSNGVEVAVFAPGGDTTAAQLLEQLTRHDARR